MTSPNAGSEQAAPVVLPAMPPAQEQGWELLVRLDTTRVPWVLIGGQMMVLLAIEYGVELPRATLDADVLVDVRARPGGIETVATWLTGQGLEMEGPSPMGIGHRFSRAADPGPGKVMVDLLAPEGLGSRTAIFTRPPARTISVPASTTLLHDAVPTAVQLPGGQTGTVRRPTVLAALVGKAAATSLPIRANRERDWQDAALLLAILPDPFTDAPGLSRGERKRLSALTPLRDPGHDAWRPLSRDLRRRGVAAARFVLPER